MCKQNPNAIMNNNTDNNTNPTVTEAPARQYPPKTGLGGHGIYDILYGAQDGRGAICSVHQSELNMSLQLDTDPRAQALLCPACLTAVRGFRSAPEVPESWLRMAHANGYKALI
jgi:hypothetical protein